MHLEFKNISRPLTLPENYLPSALDIGRTSGGQGVYPLIPVPLFTHDQQSRRVVRINQEDLQYPLAVSEHLNGLDDKGQYYLGPLINPEIDLALSTERAKTNERASAAVIGVVDFGIAFWNLAFCREEQDSLVSQFVDVGFLDFNPAEDGVPVVQFLETEGVADVVQMSCEANATQRIIDKLGDRYTNSAFANHPSAGRLYREDGANHGTAMADFALRASAEETGRDRQSIPVFGIELPIDAILDSSGDTLQAVLNVAISELIVRVKRWALENGTSPDLRVMVSFAFLGGPDDGSHSVVESLGSLLNNNPSLDFNSAVYIPTGNHLQDQLHGVLPDVSPGQSSKPLRWYLQVDDFQSNTMEVVLACQDAFDIGVSHAGSNTAQLTLDDGLYAELFDDRQLVGALWCRRLHDDLFKLRMTLGATAKLAQVGAIAPAGEWSVGFKANSAGVRNVSIWILRKDGHGLTRRLPPFRQSYLRDVHYERFEPDGSYKMRDGSPPVSYIQRAGTASLLTTGCSDFVKDVGALERVGQNMPSVQAWYSGSPVGTREEISTILVDDGWQGCGSFCLGNDGPRIFRMSGTSVAAAMMSGREV